MTGVIDTVGDGLRQSLLMAYQVWWALVLGFALSGAIQAVVSKGEMSRLLPDSSPRSILKASLLGAASSSCSYAATAIARSIFVSDSTAKTHISKIYEKLGASNRADAIMKAVRSGLLADDLQD